jgi:hypothetical protein
MAYSLVLRIRERFDRAVVDRALDWYGAVPKTTLASIGISLDAVRFDSVYAFHAARTLDPAGFLRDGILPLGAMVDRLWADLYRIPGGQLRQPSGGRSGQRSSPVCSRPTSPRRPCRRPAGTASIVVMRTCPHGWIGTWPGNSIAHRPDVPVRVCEEPHPRDYAGSAYRELRGSATSKIGRYALDTNDTVELPVGGEGEAIPYGLVFELPPSRHAHTLGPPQHALDPPLRGGPALPDEVVYRRGGGLQPSVIRIRTAAPILHPRGTAAGLGGHRPYRSHRP